MRAAVVARREGGGDAHRLERPAHVPPQHAEPVRADPLERLLLPFDRHAKPGQPQPLARVRPTPALVDRGDAGVAVEPVRVGDERPELVGARREVELEAVCQIGHVSR